jgi:uncharacterized damage-inducible protein DinB
MLAMRPTETEYAPYYATYVNRVVEGRLLETLDTQAATLRAQVSRIDEDRAALPGAPGKWSLKDILNHVSDAERVFALRLLWFARVPGAELPSFDQDAWVPTADAQRRSLADLCDEFELVRNATLALLRSLPADAAARRGIASGHPVSVRALAWIIAGHAQHHIDKLREQQERNA